MGNTRKVIEVMALEKRPASLIEGPQNYRHIRREFLLRWPSVLDARLRLRSRNAGGTIGPGLN